MPETSQPPAASQRPTDAAPDHALDMTVHSLPHPGQAEAEAELASRTRAGRLKVLLVMLMCAAPVIASYFTYYVIRPDGRRNFGELIEPQRAMPTWEAKALDGKAVPLPRLQGQWLLVAVGPSQCAQACAHNLYLQKQLQAMLGRERDRLDRVWFVTDPGALDTLAATEMKDATVLRADRAALAAWLQPTAGRQLEDHLYLVDPKGNWMMRFPAQLDLAGAGKAKRDLDRLMRANSSWDKAGREP